MKIVEPKATIWKYFNPINHIVNCAKVCYASETITDNHVFVNNLYKNKHWSMFRHVGAYYIIPCKLQLPKEAFIDAKIVLVEYKYYVSTNEQAAKEYWNEKYFKYKITEEEAKNNKVFINNKLIRYTFCVKTGIDITREYNRKSPNNIAEQSTRYVDFNKKLCICFKRCHWMQNLSIYKRLLVYIMCKTSEWFYKISRSKYGLNLKPQDARWILPLNILSKAVYTYTVKDWEYIINMRLFDWTGVAHKDAKIIASQIKTQLENEGYSIINYKEHEIESLV